MEENCSVIMNQRDEKQMKILISSCIKNLYSIGIGEVMGSEAAGRRFECALGKF